MGYGRSAVVVDAGVWQRTGGDCRGPAHALPLGLRRRPARRGFTLIEVLLVLTLLVVIGSLSIPYLFNSFTRSQLRNGGDLLRAALTQARLAAMETGQLHVMRCEVKGRRFQISSLTDLATGGGENAQAAATIAADEDKFDPRIDTKQLPSGVMFVSGQCAPSPQLMALMGSIEQEGWFAPIVFSPDGTATDATLLLANENEQTLRITLRGITGGIRVGDIGAEAMPLQ